jgi:hypothetical protein
MKNILLIFLAIVSTACSKSSGGNENGVEIDTYLDIFLKNAEGTNLIDSEFYPSQDFKVFHELNGQTVEIKNPKGNTTNGFILSTDPENKRLVLYVNDQLRLPISVTYIEWKSGQKDKITAFFNRRDNYIGIVKILLNDAPIWDITTPPNGFGRNITIVK